MNPPGSRFALVFLAWGGDAIDEIQRFLTRSRSICGYDLILITDKDTSCDRLIGRLHAVIRADFVMPGLLRKCELFEHLPEGYDAFCFLDTDTIILGDISLGFEKAMLHGIAMSPAPHYSLDHFWGFAGAMNAESVALKGQLQYNSGVIFLAPGYPGAASVFARWRSLAASHLTHYKNDQPYLTLAMEMENFNPYTLSIGYNYRGFGDYISGEVRIWHSHGDPPSDLNVFGSAWPPRRAWPDRSERAW